MTSPKMVPREPTTAMLRALDADEFTAYTQRSVAIKVWRHMFDAAPEAAPTPADDVAGLIARLRDPALSRVYGAAGERTCHEAAAALERMRGTLHLIRAQQKDDYARAEAAEAEVARLTRERDEAAPARYGNETDKTHWLPSPPIVGSVVFATSAHSDKDVILALTRRVVELEAKLAAAEQDAARYRWLRDNTNPPSGGFAWSGNTDYNARWDAAIDAAMKGKP
jgi:hypothetical protein